MGKTIGYVGSLEETQTGFFYALTEVSMPYKPKKPCAYPGCSNLTSETYCDEHKSKVRKNYNDFFRDRATKRKYGCNWKRIRDRYIAEHPLCEDCLKEGKMTPAIEVHHILPVKNGGTNNRENLTSLCKSCHIKRHIALGDRKVF